jgi:hypothetical protein
MGLLILGVISIITGVGFFIRKAFVSGYVRPSRKSINNISWCSLNHLWELETFSEQKKLAEFGTGIIGMGIALLYYSTYAAFRQILLFLTKL